MKQGRISDFVNGGVILGEGFGFFLRSPAVQRDPPFCKYQVLCYY